MYFVDWAHLFSQAFHPVCRCSIVGLAARFRGDDEIEQWQFREERHIGHEGERGARGERT